MVEQTIKDFPYIPCPPDPMARIAELEIQIRNMSALLGTMHGYLQDHKPIIDWVKEIKEKKDFHDIEELKEFMWWFNFS